MGRAGPGAQLGHHRVMSPPLPSPAGGPMHGGPMGSMQSPQSRMHGGYGGGMMQQQLLPLVKPQPSKRLEIVDPRRKSADAVVDADSSAAVAAGKGGSADSQPQFARRSEGGGAPGRPRSGAKAGSVSADGSAMLAL
jgi:hypothetical protein